MDRRRVLQGMGVGAAYAALGGRFGTAWADTATRRRAGVLQGVGSRPDPSKPEGVDLLPEIDHIVIYMQENRSFDHYFGTLGRGDGFSLDPQGKPTNDNPDPQGTPVPVYETTNTCGGDRAASQSWNASHLSLNGGANDGFVRAAGGGIGSMSYYTGDTLPFYWGLAQTFVLCDRWFSSALAQTFPNRRFLQAATSMGIVSTDVQEVLDTPDAPNGTIWDRLNAHGISWKDYAIDLADILLFPGSYSLNSSHVATFDDFLVDAVNGTLPQVSIISPGDARYSEERPNDIQLGEAYSASIVNALLQSPAWPRTALFFTYDEHGGYYDHVPPPAAVAPDGIAPRITVPPDAPGGFDRLGFRVPGFVISPYARPDYVSSVTHDHTSILKFIETKWNLGAMTLRDANADDLLDAFDFSHPAFLEPPTLPAPGVPATGSTCSDVPLPPQPLPASSATTTTTTTMPTASTSSTVTSTGSPGGTGGPASTLAAVAGQSETTIRYGSVNGDGVSRDESLPRTGSGLERTATLGGLGALAGIAAVLAARSQSRPRPLAAEHPEVGHDPLDQGP